MLPEYIFFSFSRSSIGYETSNSQGNKNLNQNDLYTFHMLMSTVRRIEVRKEQSLKCEKKRERSYGIHYTCICIDHTCTYIISTMQYASVHIRRYLDRHKKKLQILHILLFLSLSLSMSHHMSHAERLANERGKEKTERENLHNQL